MNTQNEKGFTLIELIVVIAIMGIVGAVLVPQFATMTLRSRMSTDVSTVKTVQNQIEIYYADTGEWPGSAADGKDIISTLVSTSYLDSKYVNTDSTLRLQTKKASAQFDATNHIMRLGVSADDYKKYNKEDDKTASWIVSY